MMTYREFVDRPAHLKCMIEHKIEDVQFKWTVCTNIVPELNEKVQTSTSNTSEVSIIRYVEAKNELDRLQKDYDDAVADVRGFLYSKLTIVEADALDWLYCGDKSISEIADIESLSYAGAASRIRRAEKKAMTAYLHRFEQEV